ncbi:MAG TPA: DUF2723 domain-containing protein [Gemmatimonadaceae bacterium]
MSPRREVLLAGILVLALYALTLYPDVPGGDSGELIAAITSGGVIHPPGYPLYALLGRVFVHLPHGTIAWRLNLLSAACDAAAAGVLYAAVQRATGSRAGAIAAAALFASAPGVWRYAICAEVFALNNLVVCTLLLLAVLYAQTRDRRHALAGAFVLGLGLSNHHTILFTGLPLVAWAAWTGRADLLRPKTAALLVLAFAAGLLPYLALPLADSRHAAVSWGAADTWHGFWTHVLRREYGTFQLAASGIAAPGDPVATVGAFAEDLGQSMGWWGLPGLALAVAGCVACWRARKPWAGLGRVLLVPPVLAVGVMALLGNLPVTDPLHRGIVARFWQQPDVVFFAWCGAGVALLERRVRVPRWIAPAVASALALVLVVARFTSMDHHRDRLVASYGTEILRAAPPKAVLFTKGDLITNSVRYAQVASGMRSDVRVIDLELLGFPWEVERVRAAHPDVTIPGARYMPGAPDGFFMKQLLDANVGPDRPPVLLCGGVKPGDVSADGSYGRWPFGFCELVHPGTAPVNLDAWVAESAEALPRIDFDALPRPPGSWEAIVWSDYWEVRNARAAHLVLVAGADPARRKYVAMAADMLSELVAANPDEPAHVWRNLAMALGRSGLDTPEKRAQAADAWRHWLALGPKDDPQRPAIEREVERLSRP